MSIFESLMVHKELGRDEGQAMALYTSFDHIKATENAIGLRKLEPGFMNVIGRFKP